MNEISFNGLLTRLASTGVEFIVIGGLAASIHGSAHITLDLDVCYHRAPENVDRLSNALAPIHPSLRGAPRDPPFRLDSATIRAGLNFTLDTDLGPLDLLGEVPPFGAYSNVIPHTETVEAFGFSLRILSLDALIEAKRATGRPKDQLILPELEALLALKQDKD